MSWWAAKPTVGGWRENRRPWEVPSAPIRSVREMAGIPPTASKWRTRPSKVCSRSTEVVNHQNRCRLQHKMAPKHQSTGASPNSMPRSLQSEKSNWDSSPGAVSIGTDTWGAGRKRGPRRARTARTTLG